MKLMKKSIETYSSHVWHYCLNTCIALEQQREGMPNPFPKGTCLKGRGLFKVYKTHNPSIHWQCGTLNTPPHVWGYCPNTCTTGGNAQHYPRPWSSDTIIKSIESYSSTKDTLREEVCSRLIKPTTQTYLSNVGLLIVDIKIGLFYPLDIGEFPPQLTPTEVMRWSTINGCLFLGAFRALWVLLVRFAVFGHVLGLWVWVCKCSSYTACVLGRLSLF